MNNKLKNYLLLSILMFGFSGCVPNKPTLYHWGEYENLVYDMYIEPGTADANTQVAKLTTDIQKAASHGKPVPPGIYAHLGFMYALLGNTGLSQDAFNEEKARYPESSVFIDGMMQRAKNNMETNNALTE